MQVPCQVSLLDSPFVGESGCVFLAEARRPPQIIPQAPLIFFFLLNDLLLVSRCLCACVRLWRMCVLQCVYGGQKVGGQLYEVRVVKSWD